MSIIKLKGNRSGENMKQAIKIISSITTNKTTESISVINSILEALKQSYKCVRNSVVMILIPLMWKCCACVFVCVWLIKYTLLKCIESWSMPSSEACAKINVVLQKRPNNFLYLETWYISVVVNKQQLNDHGEKQHFLFACLQNSF